MTNIRPLLRPSAPALVALLLALTVVGAVPTSAQAASRPVACSTTVGTDGGRPGLVRVRVGPCAGPASHHRVVVRITGPDGYARRLYRGAGTPSVLVDGWFRVPRSGRYEVRLRDRWKCAGSWTRGRTVLPVRVA